MMKKLSIIIPVYNEEKTILSCLDSVLNVCENKLKDISFDYEIIISNDWSKDKSIDLVKKFLKQNSKFKTKFTILDNKINKWKWAAVKTWFKQANWDIFIIQDADLEYDPNDYIPIIKKMEAKNLDIVYWSRILWFKEFNNSYSTWSFLIWWILVSLVTSILTFKKITDEPTCYKTFRKNLKNYLLKPSENWFEYEPAITMFLFKKKIKYWEIPIHYKARKPEEWKKIKWTDWIKAILTLIKWRFKSIK